MGVQPMESVLVGGGAVLEVFLRSEVGGPGLAEMLEVCAAFDETYMKYGNSMYSIPELAGYLRWPPFHAP
jgi:hypothetical protein